MILADTSVWVDHLRVGSPRLKALLIDDVVYCHPFIVGELACGSLKNRSEVLQLLSNLPQAHVASHQEVLDLIESRRLHGRGIGWIDAHLAASAVASGIQIWTNDRSLRAVAEDL